MDLFKTSSVAAPKITAFTPPTGPVGTTVTITGTAFTGATAVKFNATAAASFTVVSATSITAKVAAGTTTGKITVTTAGGSAISSTSFTVIPAPTISSFTPATGPVGTAVTITGTNLTGATAVKFNGTAASFTVASATTIKAVVAASTTTGKIAVTTRGGVATSASSFTVAAPKITAFTPPTGPVGTTVTITGTAFTGATAVKFNATAAASFTVVSATSITAKVAAGTTTGKITVTTPGGTATSGGNFVVGSPYTGSYHGIYINTVGPYSPDVGKVVFTVATSGAVSGSVTDSLDNSVNSISGTISNAGALQLTTAGGSISGTLTQNATTHAFNASCMQTNGTKTYFTVGIVPTASTLAGTFKGTSTPAAGAAEPVTLTITAAGVVSGTVVVSDGTSQTYTGFVDIYGGIYVVFVHKTEYGAHITGPLTLSGTTLSGTLSETDIYPDDTTSTYTDAVKLVKQ